jgi:aminopeptidase YwaD
MRIPFSLGSVVSWPFMIVLVPLTLTLPWIVKLWSFASKEGTPGAGDNLIASAIAVEVARYFSDSKELQHTRIIAASYDSEESGLRGARAFFKRHKHNESLLMGKVYNFNIDCPYEAKEIFFLTSDINGSVKLSESMAQRCTRIAHTLGYDAVSKPIAMLTGGTDAAEAAKVGIEATTLMAMPWDNSSRSSVYHTPQDTPDAIEPEAVEISLEIAIHVIKEIDQLSVE